MGQLCTAYEGVLPRNENQALKPKTLRTQGGGSSCLPERPTAAEISRKGSHPALGPSTVTLPQSTGVLPLAGRCPVLDVQGLACEDRVLRPWNQPLPPADIRGGQCAVKMRVCGRHEVCAAI